MGQNPALHSIVEALVVLGIVVTGVYRTICAVIAHPCAVVVIFVIRIVRLLNVPGEVVRIQRVTAQPHLVHPFSMVVLGVPIVDVAIMQPA